MIASLRGILQEKGLDRIIVDVGGVGYLAHISTQTLSALPQVGEPVHLFCHTHVREDALQIFGFTCTEEQCVFELLILVSGIGPKLALTALSGMPVGELVEAIAGADHRRLQTIPGVGRKTAERMVVELKERCATLAREISPARPHAGGLAGDVIDALANLGYKRSMAEKAVALVVEKNEEPLGQERLLREALVIIRQM